MDSSHNAEEIIRKLSNSGEAVPPRSPKKGNELSESSKSFADLLSKRLVVQENLTDDSERVKTKWIKQSLPISFNPQNSIFASNLDAAKCPDISPPGSPPNFEDDGDSTKR